LMCLGFHSEKAANERETDRRERRRIQRESTFEKLETGI
jgi:hypothetical protein